MLTDEGEEAKRIRDNVILLQVPVINPDGLDMVTDWYRKNVGTPVQTMPSTPATVFLVEYRDGLRGTVLLLNG